MRRDCETVAGAVVWAVLLAGCGGEDRPATIRVAGTVTWQGAPLPDGKITFAPLGLTAGALCRPALGRVEDGGYELSTFRAGDGVLPGEYAVLVESFAPRAPSEFAPPPPSLIPERYGDQAQTPLRAVVPAEGGALTLDFELQP